MGLQVDDRPSDSPYVARVWRSSSSAVDRMTSVATSHWELVVWTSGGGIHAGVRGPETRASLADVPDDSDSFGIVFSHGTSMPHLPVSRLVDGELESPHVTASAFVLRGDEWPLPGFDDAEQFAERLVREGVLVAIRSWRRPSRARHRGSVRGRFSGASPPRPVSPRARSGRSSAPGRPTS